MDNLFTKTPSSYFAAIAIAGVVASGYMSFEAGKPIIMALVGDQMPTAKISMTQPSQPGSTLGAGAKTDTAIPAVKKQADAVSAKVELMAQANQTKNDQVLGAAQNGSALAGSGDESTTVPVREEFPPAVNLLRNSSFEEDNNGAPRQWNYQYDSNSGNTKTTLEAIRTGAKGLKITGGGTGNFGLSQPAAKEIERRDYAFSVWVKPVSTDAHTVKLSFWDEVNNREAKSKTFSFSGTKEWSRLVFQISNKNTWNGKKWFPMITVSGLAKGALYIEDAQLEEASSYTPYHFVGGGATQAHVSILGDGSVEIDAHGNIYPAVDGVGGLGTGSNRFSELRLTKATIDNNGSLTLDGDITVNGNGTFKGAIAFDGTIKSHLVPDQDSTYDLGSTTKKWRWTYTNGVYLQNAETIGNGTDGDITFTDSGTSNALVMDLNAASDAVELRNDTEDLRLRAAGNGNLVMRAGDGAAESTVNGNDIFIASEDDTVMRADTFNLTVSAADAASIAVYSTTGGIDLSTGTNSGLGTANLTLRSGGTLKLDTSSKNSNILIDSGTGDLIVNVGTHTEVAQDNAVNAISLSASRGGILLSTSNASGNGNMILKSAGTLALQTSSTNSGIDILAGTGALTTNTGTVAMTTTNGDIVVTAGAANADTEDFILRVSEDATASTANGRDIFMAAVDDLILFGDNYTLTASNGVNYNTSGADMALEINGDNDYVLRAGDGAREVVANNNDIQLSAEDSMILDAGDFTLAVSEDAVAALTLNASRGGILLSTSNASGNGNLTLKSGGTLQLDTSATNSNVTVQAGTGAFNVNAGSSTQTYSGTYAVTDTAQVSLTSNQAAINAIALLATNGGIDISTSGVGGLGELRLRAGGSLKLDTSGNNNNILIDSGTGDLLANIGTGTISAVDDTTVALALRAARGGIELSTSNASGNGNMILKSAGTLALQTSSTNSGIDILAGTGALTTNTGTVAMTTTNGDIVVTAGAANADTEDFILRVSEDATASTANGRDIFLAAVDDLILYGDNFSATLSNGVNYEVNGAKDFVLRVGDGAREVAANGNDIQLSAVDAFLADSGSFTLATSNGDQAFEVNGDNDYVLRVGDAAAQSVANGNDVEIVAEDVTYLTSAALTVTTSTGDTQFEVNGDADFIVRAGDAAREVAANNNDIQLSAEADVIVDGATFTLNTSNAAVSSLALNAVRGGITMSTGSNAGGNSEIVIKSAGTLALDTSSANSAVLMRTGTGTLDISSGLVQVRSANDSLTAIRLLADRGGIEISSGNASGNGNVTIKSAGTLTLDTSANNSNIMVRAGTGRIDLSGNTILVNSGAGTLDLSANNTISIVSSTTARVWGETGTLVGRAGTSTRVHGRLCIEGSGDGSTCPAGADGRLFVNTTGEAAGDDSGDVFDLAEYYPASEPVDPGTVVIADSNSRATVKMSQYAYQRVLGVVSTSPAIMINDGSFEVGAGTRKYNVAKPLIALVGRVPVKVSSENGSIKVGDRLVASAKAGYAMKATKQGMTLGMALEDMSFENGATEAKVMTFVNVSWYFPEVVEELEKEYQTAQALGIQANAAAALTAATSSVPAEGSDPSVNVTGLPAVASAQAGVVAGASTESSNVTVTVATPPTEFPNLIVTKALTVGKELKVSGKATFEGEVEVVADATFGKNVIIIGNLRIGGNLEVAGAVVTNMTAGASIAAGDPVAVGADGKTYRAGAGKAVIGVATLNAAAGESVKVAVAGKVGNMTGLTTGSRYFVNEAGSLTTDGQGGQGLGVAVSATEMLVQPGIGLPAAAVTPAPVKEESVKEPVKEEVKPVVPVEQPVILSVQSPTLTTTQVQEQPIVPQTGGLNPQLSTE